MEADEQNLHPAFQHKRYLFRRKFFKIFGAAFHVYDEDNNLVFYAKQKAFKLKEDFRVYSDESETEELLVIKTPQILDFSATYYVFDPTADEVVGALKRKGWKSIFKDEWLFLTSENQQIGLLTETSWASAFMSRYLPFFPQTYLAQTNNGKTLAEIRQHFNPFILKYTLFILKQNPAIDRRLLIAAGILLAAIERRQRKSRSSS